MIKNILLCEYKFKTIYIYKHTFFLIFFLFFICLFVYLFLKL